MFHPCDLAVDLKCALFLLRQMGPRWAAARTWHALKVKCGWFQYRCPVRAWEGYRLREFLVDPGLAEPQRYLDYRRTSAPVFFFRPEQRERFQHLLKQFDTAGANPVRDAERIKEGKFRLFSHADVECGLPPDWHVNPFTGERVPANVHWSRIPVFGHGDIKCVWELSRFGFVYTLVRAYWRDGNEKWAELFWRLVEDWREHNPPNQGPQWMCGQEIAFRVMAWCFGLYGFLDSSYTTAERVTGLAQMLLVSGKRIAANLDYALSQSNNHGISEALGLWTIGVLFPEFRSSAEWERLGRYWLERLGRELIYDDGGFCQHSANYHRLMLHDYLWVLRLGDLLGRPFSAELKERVKRAGEFLWQIQDCGSGGVPCYGANDGALVLPLDNCDYVDYRPVVQATFFQCTGQRVFESGPWDESLVWLFGPDSLTAPVGRMERSDFSAPHSGVYTLRGEKTFAVVRCPKRFKHRPAHADLLHVDVWWNGVNVALDPGSYSYNAPRPWEGALADTRFHNTVTVDEADQMHRAGRFLWVPWRGGEPGDVRATATGNVKAWTGTHRCYSRPGMDVVYRRAIVWCAGVGWIILDSVRARRTRSVQATVRFVLQWLLPKTTEAEQGDNLRLKLDAGGSVLVFESGVLGEKAHWSVVKGDPQSPRGWRSAYYQHREPATSVVVEASGAEATFWTHFGYATGNVRVQKNVVSVENGAVVAQLRLDREEACVTRRVNESVEEIRAW